MNIPGIYIIQNIVTKEYYVGSSAVDIRDRIRSHKNGLRRNKHENSRLQNSWNKYKEESFRFIELMYLTNPKEVLKYEQLFIDTLNPYYNICKKADSCLGRKFSEETKKKQSEKAKLRKLPTALLKQQKSKYPDDIDGKRFCSKCKEFTLNIRNYERVCKICHKKLYSRSRKKPGARIVYARSMANKIVNKTDQIGFYSMKDAERFYKDKFPKFNRNNLLKCIKAGRQYYECNWELV